MLLNEQTGYFHQVPGWALNCAVVGAALAELGSVGWNRHTRYMAETLRLERRGLGAALTQQGLLRIYRRWCRDKRCGECPAATAAGGARANLSGRG